jgi:hypothetical protein
MNSFSILTIVFLSFIIVVLLFSNTNNIIPANEGDPLMYSNAYNEGFTTPTDYTTYPTNVAMDSEKKLEISPSVSANGCHRIFGTNGLACSPVTADNVNPMDTYSQSGGSLSCQSYGMSNSRGFLCLDENQRKLYTTRGGNAGL